MNTRQFEGPSDYLKYASWAVAHSQSPLPQEALPYTGIWAMNGKGQEVAVGFLYKTDSTIAWLEYIFKSPTAHRNDTAKGINDVIVSLIEHAKQEGFKTVFTCVNNESLIKRYKEHNFVITDTNTTQAVRIL